MFLVVAIMCEKIAKPLEGQPPRLQQSWIISGCFEFSRLCTVPSSKCGPRPPAGGRRPSAVDRRRRPLAVGCRLSADGRRRPSADGRRPSAVGCRPSAVGRRPSADRRRRQTAAGRRPSAADHRRRLKAVPAARWPTANDAGHRLSPSTVDVGHSRAAVSRRLSADGRWAVADGRRPPTVADDCRPSAVARWADSRLPPAVGRQPLAVGCRPLQSAAGRRGRRASAVGRQPSAAGRRHRPAAVAFGRRLSAVGRRPWPTAVGCQLSRS